MGAGRSAESGETVEVSRLPLPAYVWKEVNGTLTLVDCNAAAHVIDPAVKDMMGMTLAALEATGPAMGANLRHAFEARTVVSAEGAYVRRSDGAERQLAATYVYAPP